jgi:hypothetical protein
MLGLSYGAVSLVLEALGAYLCKSRVYEVVQAAAERVPGLKREQIFGGGRTPALGSDVTSVKCNGQWLTLGQCVDDTTGLVQSVDELSAEDADALKEWLAPVAEAVGAEILVSDDADVFKTVADELGLDHQVCKDHVKRNTEALIESLAPIAAQDEDGSLAAIAVSPEQALADLARLAQLIQRRQPDEHAQLETLHCCYVRAAPPRPGEQASVACRLRLLSLDRRNLWSHLTRYRTGQGPQGQTLDCSSNGLERAIGWWTKERYRTI